MKTRRTHAEVVAARRAQNATEVATPIATLRAARRAERAGYGRSVHNVASHLYYKAECSLYEIAQRLEHMGYRTPGGKLRWSAEQVRRELSRMSLREAERGVPGRGRKGHQTVRTPRYRAGELRVAGEGTRYTTAEVSRDQWDSASKALPPSQPRPPEPLLDSRGRVMKGRRFSKIKRKTG